MWAVQHLSEIHCSFHPCKHGDILTSLCLPTEGFCLMQIPLTCVRDPDPHPQAYTPACPWQVPIPKEVPSTQD